MKLTKPEKIWLIVVCIFYVVYNLPFVPHYGQAKASIIHALLTLIPLWVSVYIGLIKVFHVYRLKQTQPVHLTKEDSTHAQCTHDLDRIYDLPQCNACDSDH